MTNNISPNQLIDINLLFCLCEKKKKTKGRWSAHQSVAILPYLYSIPLHTLPHPHPPCLSTPLELAPIHKESFTFSPRICYSKSTERRRKSTGKEKVVTTTIVWLLFILDNPHKLV